MTVSELIEKLMTMDGSKRVVVIDEEREVWDISGVIPLAVSIRKEFAEEREYVDIENHEVDGDVIVIYDVLQNSLMFGIEEEQEKSV